MSDFPDEPVVPFNLACYACQLGKPSDARSWLHLSLEIAKRTGAEKEWKLRALDEKDLELLWVEIKIA